MKQLTVKIRKTIQKIQTESKYFLEIFLYSTKMLNINIGILGHVDCGKTTLAKALSDVSSTAAFDKSPQSQERGITLDLGFSAMIVETPEHLQQSTASAQLQFTFVDCPGHAKLIKTIIGGANIMDIMILVVDIQKGIQMQTSECLVIGEITCKRMIVVLNKIDLLEKGASDGKIEKFIKKFKEFLQKSRFTLMEFIAVSALRNDNIDGLRQLLIKHAFVPERPHRLEPFLFAIDHCFLIKGHGAVCTGTVLQGTIKLNDTVEIPQLSETKKIKSIQVFRKPAQMAAQGDRCGICITQFNTQLIERGLLAASGYVKQIKAAVVRVQRVSIQKNVVQTKAKLIIVVGYETSLAKVTFFRLAPEVNAGERDFDWNSEYEHIQELVAEENGCFNACLEFERPIFAIPNQIFIALFSSPNFQENQCRIAFWGFLSTVIECKSTASQIIKQYKMKSKSGHISKFLSKTEAISKDLFKEDSERRFFIGSSIELSTGEKGKISSTFGSSTKVKICLDTQVSDETMARHTSNSNDVTINLVYKKYLNKAV